VDPKSTGENKHRYVVASQNLDVRRMLRGIRGVPLIYIKRSVMILEPMADESVQIREREERRKFRAELKKTVGKRKREEKDEGADNGDHSESDDEDGDRRKATQAPTTEKKPKKHRGAKGANPLSVKKKKPQQTPKKETDKKPETAASDTKAKRKRRKKTKSENATAPGASEPAAAAPSNAGGES
jgi:U3 small nucleolar RNA-associated protein 23